MKSRASRVGRRMSVRWHVHTAPRSVLAYFLTIELVVAGFAFHEVLGVHEGGRSWAVLALLATLAISFEEAASRVARLQIRLSAALRCDMSSVWAVAGAAALDPGQGVLLLLALYVYTWFRQWRPAGEALYRKTFVVATMVGGLLAASVAAQRASEWAAGWRWDLDGAFPVLVAIVVLTVVNRALVSFGLLVMGASPRDLVGSLHDNLIELATLCLGGLVALAAMHEPFLAVLVLAPMVTLQRGALVRELETAAMTDSKTGLLNAIAWEQLAAREVGRALREKYALSVLIIDIDRFKDVNDRFGHLVGDEVLVGIGRTIKGALREYDGLGRFGGEEFVAVLPEAADEVGIVIAERIRSRIGLLSVGSLVGDVPGAAEHPLSVSIGVACLPVDGVDLPELLHEADRALYVAKETGRDRVQLARRGGEAEDDVVVA